MGSCPCAESRKAGMEHFEDENIKSPLVDKGAFRLLSFSFSDMVKERYDNINDVYDLNAKAVGKGKL